MLKSINQIVQHHFLRPAPDAAHVLEPAKPVIGFQFLRHALPFRHLFHEPIHASQSELRSLYINLFKFLCKLVTACIRLHDCRHLSKI